MIEEIDNDIDNPNTHGTDSLQNGSVHSRERLSDHHTEEVVEQNGQNVEDDQPHQSLAVSKHVEGLNGILMEHSHNQITLRVRVLDNKQTKSTNETTPHSLKTNNQGSSSLHILKKILLNDNLGSLNDLSANDQTNGHRNLSRCRNVLAGIHLRDGEKVPRPA